MKIKSYDRENNLDFLLKKQLRTKYFEKITLDNINDFPIIDIKDLKNRVFYGCFQLKQSKSYVKDFLTEASLYNVSSNLLLKDLNVPSIVREHVMNYKSKIIIAEIVPRHKRSKSSFTNKFSTLYKAIIHYQPNINSFLSIKGNFSRANVF